MSDYNLCVIRINKYADAGQLITYIGDYLGTNTDGLVSLTAGQYLWASVKNYSGANNVTFYSGNVWANRLK